MDNKELKPGATLFLPVFNEGALFYAGDGHGVQGDGEVCVTALETGLEGAFRLTVRKDLRLERPFAETETHLMSIGLDEDLDDAAKQAVREMVREMVREHQPLAQPGLHALFAGRRPAGDADRGRQQGRAHAPRQAPPLSAAQRKMAARSFLDVPSPCRGGRLMRRRDVPATAS